MTPIKLRTKPDELCLLLEEMGARLGEGARFPTVRELSRRYGVSLMTLTVALDRLEAQGVLTRRHGAGVFVAPGMRRALPEQVSLALICNFNYLRSAGHSAFWDVLIEQIQERAKAKNERCQLHLAHPTPEGEAALQRDLEADLRDGRLQGVLGVGLDRPVAEWLIERNIPLVTFAAWSHYTVGFDSEALVELGVQQLVVRGCRRIGLWKPIAPGVALADSLRYARRDEAVFRAVLRVGGLSCSPTLLQHGVARLQNQVEPIEESHQEQGYQAALDTFGKPRRTWPDGIVGTDDMMTHGLLVALEKLGLRAGHDVKIASHANRGSAVLSAHQEPLTLLEVDPALLVQALFGQLETLISGSIPDAPVIHIQPQVRAANG